MFWRYYHDIFLGWYLQATEGPKIRNSLPISITSSSSFFTFKEKMLQFLSVKSGNWPRRTYAAPYFLFINGLSHKPGGFLRSPRRYPDFLNWIISFLLVRQINDEDDDDDESTNLVVSFVVDVRDCSWWSRWPMPFKRILRVWNVP